MTNERIERRGQVPSLNNYFMSTLITDFIIKNFVKNTL
jgi:hypothetical protein